MARCLRVELWIVDNVLLQDFIWVDTRRLDKMIEKFVLLLEKAHHLLLPPPLPLLLHVGPHFGGPDVHRGLGVLRQLCHRCNPIVQPRVLHCQAGLILCGRLRVEPFLHQECHKGCFPLPCKDLQQIGTLHSPVLHLDQWDGGKKIFELLTRSLLSKSQENQPSQLLVQLVLAVGREKIEGCCVSNHGSNLQCCACVLLRHSVWVKTKFQKSLEHVCFLFLRCKILHPRSLYYPLVDEAYWAEQMEALICLLKFYFILLQLIQGEGLQMLLELLKGDLPLALHHQLQVFQLCRLRELHPMQLNVLSKKCKHLSVTLTQSNLQRRFLVVLTHTKRIHPMFQQKEDKILLVLNDGVLQKCPGEDRSGCFEPFAGNGRKEFNKLFLFAFLQQERQLGPCQEAKGLRPLSCCHLNGGLPQLSSLGDKAGIYPKICKHSNIVEVATIPSHCLLQEGACLPNACLAHLLYAWIACKHILEFLFEVVVILVRLCCTGSSPLNNVKEQLEILVGGSVGVRRIVHHHQPHL